MPVVNVTMFEGRDEDARVRIARGIAEVIAENGNLPVDAVHVIFDEKRRSEWARGLTLASRRDRTTAGGRRVEFACITELGCGQSAADEYIRLRREEIEPIMSRAPGFVGSQLFRSRDDETKFVLITRWMSLADFEAYRSTGGHDELRRKSVDLLDHRPPPSMYDVVHVWDGRDS